MSQPKPVVQAMMNPMLVYRHKVRAEEIAVMIATMGSARILLTI